MLGKLKPAAALVASLACCAGAAAHTTINPDVSVMGDIRGTIVDRPDGIGLQQKGTYELREVELAVQGYLNPYARADIFFAWHGEHAEVEEAYVTFERGLPWGLSLRAGRYLAGFGRLNLLHPHAWSFIQRPLVHEAYFGAEGLADDGISLRWLLPISSVYAELSADLLRGAAFTGGHHHHDGAEADVPPDKGFLSRLSIAGAMGEFTETAGGISLAYGNHDPAHNLKSILTGVDFKLKHKPNRYYSLTIMIEGLLNRRENHQAHQDTDEEQVGEYGEESVYENLIGAYALIDIQFRQRYNVGVKADYLEPLENKGHPIRQLQAFVGFAPVEETSLLRLTGFYRKPADEAGVYGAILQLVFSLGPHHPHYF